MRSLGLLAAVLAFAGCNFTHGAVNSGGGDGSGSGSDAGRDAPPDQMLADAGTCEQLATLGVDFCPKDAPKASVTIGTDVSFNTADGSSMPPNPMLSCMPLMSGGTPAVCLIYAQTITIDPGATLSGHGPKPLVLFATSSIDIEGGVDVASHIGFQVGTGPNNPGCPNVTAPSGGGGGQGGSFGTVGGNGGDDGVTVGSGGTAGSAFTPTGLFRGCDGQDGGGSSNRHGRAGGVVLLVSPRITIGTGGSIDASGAAALGGSMGRHGGGGAGSGGMIVLDTASISLAGNGQIFANGSHGGGGSSQSMNGVPGTDSTGAGDGGSNGFGVGSGGNGGVGAFQAGVGGDGIAGTNSDGGGGGGGGAGYVYVRGTTSLAGNPSVSPPAMQLP